jgi:hypothetical protein
MPKFYFLVDNPMNTSSAGQNKFCNFAIIDNGAIVFSMKTIKTQNVSLPIELHEWVQKKMDETKKSTPWAKATFSSIVEHALVELQRTELEEGKAKSGVGVTIQPTSETFGSGPSTRAKKTSRKAG